MVSTAGALLTPKEKEIFGTRLDPGARQAAGSSTYTAEASWTKFAFIGRGAPAVEGVGVPPAPQGTILLCTDYSSKEATGARCTNLILRGASSSGSSGP